MEQSNSRISALLNTTQPIAVQKFDTGANWYLIQQEAKKTAYFILMETCVFHYISQEQFQVSISLWTSNVNQSTLWVTIHKIL